MTTTPDDPHRPETPDEGDVDAPEIREDTPPREVTDPQFDDDGDGGEPDQS